MCKQEKTVKVKSYDSGGVTFFPFIFVVSAFFVIVTVFAIDCLDEIYQKLIVCGVVITVFVGAIIIGFLDTYVFYKIDIYSETGIKRVKGKKVIFEVGWENINEMAYLGLYGILCKTPFCIMGESKIKLTEKPQLENLSLDTKTFWTPVKLKQLIEIMEISPVEIVIDDATKRRIERYKKKLAKKENKEKTSKN